MSDHEEKGKPIGSGIFSLLVGVLFIVGGRYLIWMDYRHIPLRPIYVLAGWLGASGLIAIIWGVQRIMEARKRGGEDGKRSKSAKDFRIGQSTIEMIVSMVAATFVIAAIVLEPPKAQQNANEVANVSR